MIPPEDKNKPDPPPINPPVKIEISKELSKLFALADIRREEITALDEALTHSSYANEMGGEMPNNERLELLGDAVIELIIREYLFKRFPDYAEGKMTQIKTNLVNTFALARVAKRISLAESLLLGRGEKASGGKRKPTILAQTFEAVIGAIYLSAGLERTAHLVLAAMEEEIHRWLRMKESLDVKGQLQQHVQKERGVIPQYVTRDYGDDMFVSVVYSQEEVIGSGIGRSKKEAEKRSAFEALKHLGVITAGEEKHPAEGKKEGSEIAKSAETSPRVDIRFRRRKESLPAKDSTEPDTSKPAPTPEKPRSPARKKRPKRLFRKKGRPARSSRKTSAAEVPAAGILQTTSENALPAEAGAKGKPNKPKRKWRQRKPKPGTWERK
jgi:ribonuclease-3